MVDPSVVWRFTDATPGHDNQSAGLVKALAALRPVAVHNLPAAGPLTAVADWLLGRATVWRDLPDPALIIGAGHATHVSLLAAARARGGRTVVLMRPSLPVAWFDLCLIPEHDRPKPATNVLETRGALNAMAPAAEKRTDQGLILLGGPSQHHGWNTTQILNQVMAVADRDPNRQWTVTGSRRTPPETLRELATRRADNLRSVDSSSTDADWLAPRLAAASRVWVTEDSVSMVYEALTAGAATGVLHVPHRHKSRVAAGVDALVDEKSVTRFSDWLAGRALRVPDPPPNEAARCAQWIVQRWF